MAQLPQTVPTSDANHKSHVVTWISGWLAMNQCSQSSLFAFNYLLEQLTELSEASTYIQ